MKGTILVADDDKNTLTSLEEGLTGEGFKVLSAASGTEGLELVRTSSPDLILTDLMMPGISGSLRRRFVGSPPISSRRSVSRWRYSSTRSRRARSTCG